MAKIFVNVTKAVYDLENRGIEIWKLTPENILVNENTGEVKIILNEACMQNLRKKSEATYSYMMPTLEEIKYQSPELLEYQMRSATSSSWSIGLMM